MSLEVIKVLRKKIAELEERLVALRNLAAATSKALDGMPHAKARTSPTEKIAVAIVDAENELSAAKAEMEASKPALVSSIVEKIKSPSLATVLILHDVEGLSFRETARRMSYSLRNIFSLHKQARADFLKGGST